MQKMKRSDSINQLTFKVLTESNMKINIKNNYQSEKSNNTFKINNEILSRGEFKLNKNDLVEIYWS